MASHSGNVTQEVLLQQLKIIFPADKVNARKQTKLKYGPERTHYLELDIWYPTLNICFEFQDHHHYITTWYSQQSSSQIIDIKKDIVRHSEGGIDMIIIPCWWDGTAPSLASTIRFQCPHLPVRSHLQIPLNPPCNFLKIFEVPRVGELMYASFPSHSQVIPQHIWWLGEKYDGIRYCWNQQKIVDLARYSRFANEVSILPQMANNIGPLSIDGEIWLGRGSFSLALMLLNSSVVTWELLRLIAFDSPPTNAENLPFEARYNILLDTIKIGFLCTGDTPLETIIRSIVHNEGEGIILRRAGSQYIHGRSLSLLKLKSVFGDSEGLVVRVLHKSIQLQLPSGQSTNVPSANILVQKLAVGDVVTYSYEHYNQANRNILVDLKITRVRRDVTWQNVVGSFRHSIGEQTMNDVMTHNRMTTYKMRSFMESFAKSRHMDPLTPDTWYNITTADLLPLKKGKLILRKLKGYVEAVKHLFSELDFDNDLFIESWNTVAKRRHFFESYANNTGFDSLVPENWYSQSKQKIKEAKGAEIVVAYYRGRVSRALFDLFPEIGLDISKLKQSSWEDPMRRRKFFEEYAHVNGFDPLIANNWYFQSKSKIRSEKNVEGMLLHHSNSVSQALVTLFPDIGLDITKLQHSTREGRVKRRRVFVRFAEENSFDALDPVDWYQQSRANLYAVEKIRKVLSHYSNSIIKALLDLFPDIGLVKSKLTHLSAGKTRKQREFFEGYAKENKFDPLDPTKWYKQSIDKILTTKGAKRVLGDQPDVPKSLLRIYPNIGLNEHRLQTLQGRMSSKRRKFFESYAKSTGFDPLQPENWYLQSKTNIISLAKGATRVFEYYDDSLPKALLANFPEIGIDETKFRRSQKEAGNRRSFFEHYASENGFDPLVAENWYSLSKDQIRSAQGATRVLRYHSNSVAKALVDLFPEIGLDVTRML